MLLACCAATLTAATPPPPTLDMLLARITAGGSDATAAIGPAAAAAAMAGKTDPALEADARMKIAETLMLSDAPAAVTMAVAARVAAVRAKGSDSALVSLVDYRLTMIRALGGDRAGQVVPMVGFAEQLAGRAKTAEERTSAAQALIVAATFAASSGEAALTERTRDEALALLARSDLARNSDLAEAYRVAADVFIYQNRAEAALPWADRSIALYEALGDDNPAIIYALARRGLCLQRLSRYREAQATLRRAVALSDKGTSGDPTLSLLAVRALGIYYGRIGEPDLALPLLKRALAEAKKLPPGFPYAGSVSRDIMQTLLGADRTEQARVYAEETASRAKATLGPNSYEYASAILVLARIDTRAGRYDAAKQRIDEADAVLSQRLVANNSRRFEALAARGDLLAKQGRCDEAAALYDRARAMLASMPPDDPDRIDMAEGMASATLGTGHPTEAGWHAARDAADGLTTRLVRQASGSGSLDAEHGRNERVFSTAIDIAWARAQPNAASRMK